MLPFSSPSGGAMGNCTSTQDCQAKVTSDAIDKEIKNDGENFRKESKILLLGKCDLIFFDLVIVDQAWMR